MCRVTVTDLVQFASAAASRGHGLLGSVVALRIYAERYVERFTVTPFSETLVTTHNVSLRIREDLGPSLLHASPAELPTHNNREKRDYSCKNLEMGTVYTKKT